jgi:Holliday junction resolvase YEN1
MNQDGAANPIEKAIMWRILHSMKYNIQLIWVFDGPRRPWKRNKRGGGGRPQDERERTQLLCQLLDHLKVPHHHAPAEAEAECARMQQLGIVDAVWSDDGDTLMFGATSMISAHKVGKNWSTDEIRVVQAEKVLAGHDMDRESLVLFAMLSGGDYNTDGLPDCGPQIARKIARKQSGLAHALCQASKHELPAWRLRLEEAFHQAGKRIPVPFTFPDWKALGHYSNPVVTPENELRNLICLRSGWDPKIDQAKLRVLLRRRFNMWTKGYMKHVAPVFMIRQLARCQPHDEVLVENLKYDIQVKKTRKQKPLPGEDAVIALETKITFYPLPAVDIEIFEPEGEDWSIFEKDGSHYDPAGHIECNVLNCFLEHGLPQGFLVAPEPPKRQRKSKAATTASDQVVTDVTPPVLQGLDSETTAAVENAPKKRGRPKKSSTTTSPDAASADIVPKKRGRLPKDGNTPSAKQPPKKPKGRQEIDDQVQPPAPVFRLPPAFSFTSSASSTQSSGDSTQPGQSSELLNQQAGPTRRAIDSFSQSPRPPNNPQAHPTPKAGEAASPATLRALRAATWDFTGPKAVTPTSSSGTLRAVPPAIPSGAVYIDLTD